MKFTLLWMLLSGSFFACDKKDNTTTQTPPAAVSDSIPPQYGTPFANVPDRQDVNLYQINMRAFSQAGNFNGVTARLDSIKALGINVIYLMPIYPVGVTNSVNSPYCVKNYRAINAEFGNLSDLKALVDGAHSRNMAVILDWVANHTSWDNAWISDHKDWYQQDASGNIVSPPGTGWTDVAQLNFNNQSMRQTMIRSMKYWVYAANIDGFRCDYADGPPVDFWKQAIDTLRNITTHKLLMMAEGKRSGNFSAGFDYNFGFSFYENLKDIYGTANKPVTSIDAINTSDYLGTGNGQQMVRYITNHDVNSSDGTPQQLFGGANGAMAAFAIVACMESVPMIYNGQEVGMAVPITFPFTTVKINWNTNPDVTANYKAILAFRSSSTAIRRGTLTSFSNTDVCAFKKVSGADQIIVLSNLRNANEDVTLPSDLNGSVWTNALTGATITLSGQTSLTPYQYIILKK